MNQLGAPTTAVTANSEHDGITIKHIKIKQGSLIRSSRGEEGRRKGSRHPR